MKRWRRTSATKTRRRKPTRASRHRSGHQPQANEQLRRELAEAREQQKATADVLKVISSSTFDLQTVLDTLVETATRLCHAKRGLLFRRDGDLYRGAAYYGYSAEFRAFHETHPIAPGRGTTVGRTALEGKTIHIPDVLADPEYTFLDAQKLGQYRANLGVPLLRGGEPIGALSLARAEPLAFSDKEIELVEAFAAQAVIAIENTRLLNELRKSLQQQTATADVLKVISRSTFDLQTVLNTLVKSACRLCDARGSSIWRPEGDAFKLAANFGDSASRIDALQRYSHRPGRETCTGRVLLEGRTVQIPDAQADPEYKAPDVLRAGGNRAMLGVPLLREGLPIGVLTLTRSTARPFTAKQIELATTFADQAVIAIENVRLFDDVQKRTQELSESLEQQTATSEVLKVISSSPGELEPVFKAMLANATDICEAKFGFLWLAEGDGFRAVAMLGVPSAVAEETHYEGVIRFAPDVPLGRVALTKQLVHVADIRDEPGYAKGFRPIVKLADTGGARTLVAVPMLKDNELVGAIAIYRQEVRAFTDKQIELVQNFAAQAVIAIENTRLLNELRQRTDDLTVSLEQQTATSEVLSVISSSVSDAQPVFETIARSAARICDARFCHVFQFDGKLIHFAATHGYEGKVLDALKRVYPIPPGRKSAAARAILNGVVEQIPDVEADPEYGHGDTARAMNFRSLVAVPMLKGGRAVGAVVLSRPQVGDFPERQIELLRTFADQAVIAIENTRLLSELRESLQQQTATADVLKIISRSAFDLKTVLDTLLRSAARLCEADQGTITHARATSSTALWLSDTRKNLWITSRTFRSS